MSAVAAVEQALGLTVDSRIAALRRLLYCGEWIQSHALHIHMLHAPDFLGYESGLAMAGDHPDAVRRGLRIKKAGNLLMELLGGRAVHPINVRVGGFHRAPTRAELQPVAAELEWARDAALETVRWTATFPCPPFEREYHFVALRGSGGYPFIERRVASSGGLDVDSSDFGETFVEEQVEHSTALHARRRDGGAYMVGPLARYALNFDALSAVAKEEAMAAGLGRTCRNPFQSIVVRSVEMLHACDEALRLIEAYERPDPPAAEAAERAGTGHGCTEAPRGLLYHRYVLDERGLIADARIVPPTSQNLPAIEDDLQAYAGARLELSTAELTWQCEQAIRNYDPCISCATHFLRLEIERS
jgi:coenzyme F420-reducing hydrogenase alpha subunit